MTTTTLAATMLPDRALIRLSGPDVRDFLQGLVTNDMGALTFDRPLWAALLSAQGKVMFDFILWADDGDVLVDCAADMRDALVRRFTLYRLRRPISIVPEDELAVHWSAQGGTGMPDPRDPALGWRWLGAPAAAADAGDYARRRMMLAIPEGVAELGQDRTLWLEANAGELNGVSFTKGCYVGQENTARMHYRGKVRRRLLPLSGVTGLAPGPVMAGNREAGELRAIAGDVGLAWLRLEHAANGDLSVAGRPVDLLEPVWLADDPVWLENN